MFRLRLLPCLLLLSVCAAPFALTIRPAFAGKVKHAPKRDARQEITVLEQQWRTATLGGDVASMDGLLSDDYVGISWTGQVNTKTSQLERLRSRSLQITNMELSDMKIRVVGSVAIVTSRAELEGSNDGQAIKGTFLYTRIYQRSVAGTWKITNFESTRVPAPGHGSHAPHTGPLPSAEK